MRSGIVECWRLGLDFEAKLTRFVGLGSALMAKDFYGHWRHWRSDPRVLTLKPGGKRAEGKDTLYYDHLCDTLPTVNTSEMMSKAYPLAWDSLTVKSRTTIEGVDLEEYEREYLDSYA